MDPRPEDEARARNPRLGPRIVRFGHDGINILESGAKVDAARREGIRLYENGQLGGPLRWWDEPLPGTPEMQARNYQLGALGDDVALDRAKAVTRLSQYSREALAGISVQGGGNSSSPPTTPPADTMQWTEAETSYLDGERTLGRERVDSYEVGRGYTPPPYSDGRNPAPPDQWRVKPVFNGVFGQEPVVTPNRTRRGYTPS